MKKNRLKNAVHDAIKSGKDPKDKSWQNYPTLIGEEYTVEQGWRFFRTSVIPPDASVVQVSEMKKSYMAGFAESFKVMTDYASELPEYKACRFLDRIEKECSAIVESLVRDQLGRQGGTQSV